MAAAFLSSEAFNSMTVHPFSLPMALANVVFPTPGGPDSKIPLFAGGFGESHCSSQIFILLN